MRSRADVSTSSTREPSATSSPSAAVRPSFTHCALVYFLSTFLTIIPFAQRGTLLFLFAFTSAVWIRAVESATAGSRDWTNSGYPDLRGPTFRVCQVNVTSGELLYICDPDGILNATDRLHINTALEKLAVATPCPCQRRSQCSSGGGKGKPLPRLRHNSPDRAASFCKTLEGRWALGDCGNSVLIFIWQHYKKMIIWPARLAERYVTSEERKNILLRVNDLVQTDRWAEALAQVIDEIHMQLKGEPEDRVDTGTLSLIIAVGVASLLTVLITCCVCAFRCCGNLTPDEDTRSLSQNDSSFASMTQFSRNIHHFRRSTSRSPKFPIRGLPETPINYLETDSTTMV
ncbi:hypothetical protein M3Y99_00609000 [Aphelenchoides fujianensis]|nr:hypothetical protein M3Y99_00609000 [Aphelenchoides fujianensis]